MANDHTHNNLPSLEEILAAARPGTPEALRQQLKERLRHVSTDDVFLLGVRDFLNDHDDDFDALYRFLQEPSDQRSAVVEVGKSPWPKRLSIAAVMFTVLAVAGWLLFSQLHRERVLEEAMLYEPGLPVFASLDGDKDFNEMMSAFLMEEPKEGLRYYRALIETYPANDTLHYFGGWLYFQDKQYGQAAGCFEKVKETAASIYAYKAGYMRAISLYRMDERAQARELLQNIANDTAHPYCGQAGKLLEEKGLW